MKKEVYGCLWIKIQGFLGKFNFSSVLFRAFFDEYTWCRLFLEDTTIVLGNILSVILHRISYLRFLFTFHML